MILLSCKQYSPNFERNVQLDFLHYIERGHADWPKQLGSFIVDYIPPVPFIEISIEQIKRRSDMVLYYSDRKIVNVEFKLKDVDAVIQQAIDHSSWADYSVICIPKGAYISNFNIQTMIKHKLGLIIATENDFVEVIYPGKIKRDKWFKPSRDKIISLAKNKSINENKDEKNKEKNPKSLYYY